MNDQQFEIGQQHTIDADLVGVINQFLDLSTGYQDLLARAALKLGETKREMFDAIREKHPELDGYGFAVKHSSNMVTIVGAEEEDA